MTILPEPQVQWGGTHRFNDTAAVEAKHRVSLKSHGGKVRVRRDTLTEQDLLRVSQEELVFETMEHCLNNAAASQCDEDSGDDAVAAQTITVGVGVGVAKKTITAGVGVVVATHVHGEGDRDMLIHQEVLLSWGEVLDMFQHCFPCVVCVPQQTTWEVCQHAIQHGKGGTRYHYWATDTRYVNASGAGLRSRRDMVRVSHHGAEHVCEIVCFVKARFPIPASPGNKAKFGERVGVLVRWMSPHPSAVIQNGLPMCPGLRNTHRLWAWHQTDEKDGVRLAISGYRLGRLPAQQKQWLRPRVKREGLLRASHDVLAFESIGKYANVTKDFCTDGYLESESWA